MCSPFGTERCFALFLAFVCLYWKGWSFCSSHLSIRIGFDKVVGVRYLLVALSSPLFFLFVGEDFMDSCNFPYVLRAMPVFGVLSVNLDVLLFVM